LNKPQNFIVTHVPSRRLTKEQDAKARLLRINMLLSGLLDEGRRRHPDLAALNNAGYVELFDLLEAWRTGQPHPWLTDWKQRTPHNHPGPARHERAARRAVLMACEALECLELARTGKRHKTKVRREVAEELKSMAVFDAPPSADTIKHWQDRDEPPLTAEEKQHVVVQIARYNSDAKAVMQHFLGLARAVHAPGMLLMPEDAS
jgi:hypothetical protein